MGSFEHSRRVGLDLPVNGHRGSNRGKLPPLTRSTSALGSGFRYLSDFPDASRVPRLDACCLPESSSQAMRAEEWSSARRTIGSAAAAQRRTAETMVARAPIDELQCGRGRPQEGNAAETRAQLMARAQPADCQLFRDHPFGTKHAPTATSGARHFSDMILRSVSNHEEKTS